MAEIERLQKAKAAAAEGWAHIQQQMDKVFEYTAFPDTMIAAEILSHFASSPPEVRQAELQRAYESGDVVTLKGLGAGPSYLTGLSVEQHKAMVRDRLVSLHPETPANSIAAKAFDEQTEFATLLEATVLQSAAEMIDFVEAASFEAAAQDAVAA